MISVSASQPVAMLRRDEDPLDLDRPLASAARRPRSEPSPAPCRRAAGTAARRPCAPAARRLRDLVREHDRQRHQLGRLVASRSRTSSPGRPRRRGRAGRRRRVVLDLVARRRRPARCRATARRSRRRRRTCSASKPVLGARVADLARSCSRTSARDVDVGLGRDLAGDDDESGRDQRLAGDAAGRIVREARRRGPQSETWSRDLVRMATLRDGLGGEARNSLSTGARLLDRLGAGNPRGTSALSQALNDQIAPSEPSESAL